MTKIPLVLISHITLTGWSLCKIYKPLACEGGNPILPSLYLHIGPLLDMILIQLLETQCNNHFKRMLFKKYVLKCIHLLSSFRQNENIY